MLNFKTHYDNLQVSPRASDAVIRAAYKSLAQKYHPDKFDGIQTEAERVMKIINEAYAVLTDPVLRKRHDQWIDSRKIGNEKQAASGASSENQRPKEASQPSTSAEQSSQPRGQQQNTPSREYAYDQATRKRPNKTGVLFFLGLVIIGVGYMIAGVWGGFSAFLMYLFRRPIRKFVVKFTPIIASAFAFVAAIALLITYKDYLRGSSQPPQHSVIPVVQAESQVPSSFVPISLPQNVSIELPKNWVIATKNTRTTMESYAESLGEHKDSDLGFYAECYGQENQRIANINVIFIQSPPVSQSELRAFTPLEIENSFDLQGQLNQEFKRIGARMLSWEKPKRVEINGVILIEYGYSRVMPGNEEGAFNVKTLHMFAGPRSFKLTIGYSANRAQVIEPIINHIIGSIKQK